MACAAILLAGPWLFCGPGFGEDDKPVSPFSPEVQKKFDEVLEKGKENVKKVLTQHTEREVAGAAKAAGLSEETTKTLLAVVPKAAEAAAASWLPKARKTALQEASAAVAYVGSSDLIAQLDAQLDGNMMLMLFQDMVQPMEQTVWTETLQHALSPEQLALWNKTLAERREAIAAEVGDFVNRIAARKRQRLTAAMLNKSAEVKAVLNLPKERGDQLDTQAKEVANQAAEKSRARTERALLEMDDDARRRLTGNRNVTGYDIGGGSPKPGEKDSWQAVLEKFLSDEERKQLQTALQDHKRLRERVMGEIMLALLDDKVAFTSDQRERLQPIAERLIKGDSNLFPGEKVEGYMDFSPRHFLAAANPKSGCDEVKAILDAPQFKHWQNADESKKQDDNDEDNSGVIQPVNASAPAPGPSATPEPEEFERVISDFLIEKSNRERRRAQNVMLLKAEDAARVAALPPEVGERLRTAALGATETVITEWKVTAAQVVHSQLEDATALNVRQRLDGIQEYYFRGRGTPPDAAAIWTNALQTQLSDEQRANWQKEVDARAAYREHAITELILAEFDRRHSLSQDQWQKLEPSIRKILKDYDKDVARMFSSSNSTPWYLMSYTMFMPLAGIPEKDMKEILTKEQWDHWSNSEECGNATSYWENVKQFHRN